MVTEIQLQSIIGYSFLESRHLSRLSCCCYISTRHHHFILLALFAVCIKRAQTIVQHNKSMDFREWFEFCFQCFFLLLWSLCLDLFRALTRALLDAVFIWEISFGTFSVQFPFGWFVLQYCYVNDRLHFMIWTIVTESDKSVQCSVYRFCVHTNLVHIHNYVVSECWCWLIHTYMQMNTVFYAISIRVIVRKWNLSVPFRLIWNIKWSKWIRNEDGNMREETKIPTADNQKWD